MSDINIGALSEAINDKADRDLDNVSILVQKTKKIYDGTIAQNNTITFSDDPTNYDWFIGITDGGLVLKGTWRDTRIKLCGQWSGVDASGGSQYNQTYALDFGGKSGSSYLVWSYGWSSTTAQSFTQLSNVIKIYGIKLIGQAA